MQAKIEILLEKVALIIDTLRDNETFTTVDVLRKYYGRFHSNSGTSPARSPNAEFGKFLMNNATILKIAKIRAGVRIKDDKGRQTSTTEWKLIS